GIDPVADRGEIDRLARKLKNLPGVTRVDALTGEYLLINNKFVAAPPIPGLSERFVPPKGEKGTYLSVIPTVDPLSSQGEQLVKDIRATPSRFPFTVAGLSARLVDTKHAVLSRVPLAIALVAFATFVLLFLMTGSLLIPLKALLLNVLSLTATFGATVWIFQEGHFADQLHFTPTGTIDVFTPILMFCIAFGLSMDYEVFL